MSHTKRNGRGTTKMSDSITKKLTDLQFHIYRNNESNQILSKNQKELIEPEPKKNDIDANIKDMDKQLSIIEGLQSEYDNHRRIVHDKVTQTTTQGTTKL